MAFLGPRGSRERPAYVGRVFVTRPTPHGLVVSYWPRKRGRPVSSYDRSILDRLRLVTQHVARLNDREVAPLRDALADFNRTHRGLRGTASIRLEDLLTQHGFGRLFAYRLPNGRTLYHRDAILDVSRRLDWLEPTPGAILTRTPTDWLPTFACEPGARCRLMPSIPMAGCCPPAAQTPGAV